MLLADILSSNTTLNNFTVINALEFIPGDTLNLVFRLKQSQRTDGLRYIPVTDATLTVTIPNKDCTVTTLTAAALVQDTSIWSVVLTPTVTAAIAGGSFTFALTEGVSPNQVVTQGVVEGGLQMVITGKVWQYGL